VADVERTLVLLKPDAVARGLIGRVIQRFEDAGLKVVGTKMVQMDAERAKKHYFDLEERFGKGAVSTAADGNPPLAHSRIRSRTRRPAVRRRAQPAGASSPDDQPDLASGARGGVRT
jgi:hypothetical protein